MEEYSASPKDLKENEYVDKLVIKAFDPVEDIINTKKNVKNASITIVGKRRSGKSELIRAMYYKLKGYYKSFYLCTYTYETNKEFWNFIPEKNIIHGINEERLKEILAKQVEEINNAGSKELAPYICIIFDDIINDETGVRYSSFISNLYANGRHYNICSILATQSLKKVSKHARDNTDITVCYRLKNEEDREAVYSENLTAPSKGIGLKILDKVSNVPYQSIVFLNYLDRGNIDSVRTYIADLKEVEKIRTTVKTRTVTKQKTASRPKTFEYSFFDT